MKIIPPPTSAHKYILYSAYGSYIQYVCIGGYICASVYMYGPQPHKTPPHY